MCIWGGVYARKLGLPVRPSVGEKAIACNVMSYALVDLGTAISKFRWVYKRSNLTEEGSKIHPRSPTILTARDDEASDFLVWQAICIKDGFRYHSWIRSHTASKSVVRRGVGR